MELKEMMLSLTLNTNDKYPSRYELQADDIAVTGSGDTGEDLKLSPLARNAYPISIECKNTEKASIWEWIKHGVPRDFP